jgi:hypothetical protein
VRFAAFSCSALKAVFGCAEALLGDRRLLLWGVALAIEQALNRGHQERTTLRVGLALLGNHLVLLRELLIGKVTRSLPCSAGHRSPP